MVLFFVSIAVGHSEEDFLLKAVTGVALGRNTCIARDRSDTHVVEVRRLVLDEVKVDFGMQGLVANHGARHQGGRRQHVEVHMHHLAVRMSRRRCGNFSISS